MLVPADAVLDGFGVFRGVDEGFDLICPQSEEQMGRWRGSDGTAFICAVGDGNGIAGRRPVRCGQIYIGLDCKAG